MYADAIQGMDGFAFVLKWMFDFIVYVQAQGVNMSLQNWHLLIKDGHNSRVTINVGFNHSTFSHLSHPSTIGCFLLQAFQVGVYSL